MRILSSLVMCAMFISCGKKSSSSDGSTITNNAASGAGTSATNASTDALSEGGSTSSGLVAMSGQVANLIGDTDLTVTKKCTANSDGTVTVVMTRSGTGSKTVTRKKLTIVHALTATGTDTRVWTPPTGQTISCIAADKGASIGWNNTSLVNGLKLTSTVDKTHHIDVTKTVTATGVATTRKDYDDLKGVRTTTWTAPSTTTAPTGSITRDKSIVLTNVTATSIHTQSDGTDLTLSSTIASDSAAPLAVTVQRSSTSPYALQAKTIKSGTVIVTGSDGTVTKNTLASLIYDLTSANTEKCVPTGGTMSGSVYASATATTATKTYVMTFGVSTSSTGITIAYDSGAAADYDYTNSGCDLEREAAGR